MRPIGCQRSCLKFARLMDAFTVWLSFPFTRKEVFSPIRRKTFTRRMACSTLMRIFESFRFAFFSGSVSGWFRLEEKLHLFKKVGSNFIIEARTVLFEPRGAWKILSDSGFFGGNTFVSALRADPISASDSDFQFWRREWDSNPRTLASCTLSKRVPSTTRPSLRYCSRLFVSLFLKSFFPSLLFRYFSLASASSL